MAACRCNGCRMLERAQERAWPRWENVREERQREEAEDLTAEIQRMRAARQANVTTTTTPSAQMYQWYTGTIGGTGTAPTLNATISNLRDEQENEYFTPQGGMPVNAPAVPPLGSGATWGELTRNGEQPEWGTR